MKILIKKKTTTKKKDVEFLCQLFTLKEIDYKYLHLHSSHNETRNFKHRFVHVMNSFALSLFIYKFFMRVSEQMHQKEMLKSKDCYGLCAYKIPGKYLQQNIFIK